VHSAYERWSAAWRSAGRPTTTRWLELSGVRSDGEAAYADRMHGRRGFDRENVGAALRAARPAPWRAALEGQAFYNYVDHVMDNFSLRDFTPTTTMPGAGRLEPGPSHGRRPDRLAISRSSPLAPGAARWASTRRRTEHSLRSTMNETCGPTGRWRARTTRASASGACSGNSHARSRVATA
jgi:iron complex outermembrane recepter protein